MCWEGKAQLGTWERAKRETTPPGPAVPPGASRVDARGPLSLFVVGKQCKPGRPRLTGWLAQRTEK